MKVIEGAGRQEFEEDSVLLAAPDFARRRFRARLARLRPYLIVAAVVLALGTGTWLLYFSAVLTVESVKISGNGTLSSARIERVAAVPDGEQLIQVDLAAIQARIERIDAVASAEVSRSWPHAISIEVTERVPIAVVRRGEETKALDADGILFSRNASSLEALPVVETALNVNAATLAEAARVVLALRSDIAARVDVIRADSIDNIVLALDGGVRVQWGSAEDSENKAQVLAILLENKDVTEIDVSVPGRPTTR